ncbi:hypothetical protein NC651_035175 [Populus alba x Populus x berolinensis]|nr:hypothetical protein NC651_035172 [Populus alba x Populus x berolinensis]KAJ6864541.1 hypothetical protein NC651_035175 [Populus alba x Populus x berolinensis]
MKIFPGDEADASCAPGLRLCPLLAFPGLPLKRRFWCYGGCMLTVHSADCWSWKEELKLVLLSSGVCCSGKERVAGARLIMVRGEVGCLYCVCWGSKLVCIPSPEVADEKKKGWFL